VGELEEYGAHPDQMQVPTVTMLIGLPGSGKSTYIEAQDKDTCVIDDFLHKTIGNEYGRPDRASKLPILEDALLSGKEIVMADIQFCDDTVLTATENVIRGILRDALIVRRYYENDVAQTWLRFLGHGIASVM
jgi:hypothetical protein